jgi:hypothetical protein
MCTAFRSLSALGCVIALWAATPAASAGKVSVTVGNELALARPSETIVLDATEVVRLLAIKDARRVHVTDAKSGKELLTQVVDLDGDGVLDQLLFQVDLAAGESRRLALTEGEPLHAKASDFRAYGRFVRERFDDFAWENERVAHRMYGKALETWLLEPLTSSTVDVWCKRTRRLVVNDWYMADNYHSDSGEGADFYSAGTSRGCGGSGLWVGGRLWSSRNFVQSRVIANGPLRVVFELVYEPWMVAGQRVAEVKRISLDAGQQLNRFESRYLLVGGNEVIFATGLKKAAGATIASKKEAAWLRSWEAIKGDNGNLGLAIVMDPAALVEVREDEGNNLMVAKAPAGQPAVYYAGSAWDRGGDIADAAAWDVYLDRWAERLRSPVTVKLMAE